ncbi:MAG: hypothetical protein U1D00_29950 [Mycobacterium sp.]|nr:hypothetical protein [Mycobacterium sp.]
MSRSLRPWVTTGVAVVGAGVIAVAPVEPTPHADVRIANSAVDLTAAPSPFEYYPQVLMRSLANTGDRLDEYFADPFPVVRAIAESQLEALDSILGAAVSHDPAAVVRAIVDAVARPVLNLARVVSTGEPLETAVGFLVRLALPVVSGVFAAGAAVGDVAEALFDLDIVGAVNAATNIPARVIDGFLNGVVDGETHAYYGFVDPVFEAPVVDQLSGPVAFLIESLQDIGETISSSPSTAGQVPDLAAPTIALSGPPEEPVAEEGPAPEVTAEDTDRAGGPESRPAPEPTESESGIVADGEGADEEDADEEGLAADDSDDCVEAPEEAESVAHDSESEAGAGEQSHADTSAADDTPASPARAAG